MTLFIYKLFLHKITDLIIDITTTTFNRLLDSLREEGKPLILTEEGRGVAAIVPYTDPATLINDDSRKKFSL